MIVLGIESSCDECAAALVEDGTSIRSSIVATQIERHAQYDGVVPEIASRLHVEWIQGVVDRALDEAKIDMGAVDGIAVTVKPGLAGSLLVGLSYAKALAWASGKPLSASNHILPHFNPPPFLNA